MESIVSNPSPNGQHVEEATQPVNRIVDAAPDPFDLESLRVSEDYGALGVKKVLTVVPCRKPGRHDFVRVRPGEEWRLSTQILEDKIDRQAYLVAQHLRQELGAETYPVCLFLTTTRQGNVMLWPCKMPRNDGRSNHWNDSALEAARLAETRWIRLSANMAAGMYDVSEAAAELSEPTWPDLDFQALLRLCFKDRFIQTLDHPILRSLRGEV